MKINKLLFFAVVILFAASCSKNKGGDLIPSPESNPIEDVALDANLVTDNFVIQSATQVQGALPAANGSISVEISTDEQTAFLRNGFNIEFTPSSAIAGAYIQILDPEGNPSNSYFDIPSYGFGAGFTGQSGKEVKLFSPKNGDDENAINVDFGADMSPGTFCYTICFYDGEGNISAPVEVCVEVESWGGFPALAGDWKFTKYTSDLRDATAGQDVCVSSGQDLPCSSGASFKADEVCQSTSIDLMIEEDGDFRLASELIYKTLDFEASFVSCSAKYADPEEWDSYFEGKWAYDEEEDRMTLVYFNGVSLGIELDAAAGELGYEGVTTVSGNSLVINLEIENPLTEETTVHIYYFNK